MSIKGRKVERGRAHLAQIASVHRLLLSSRSIKIDARARLTKYLRNLRTVRPCVVLARWMDQDNRGGGRKGRPLARIERGRERCDEVVALLPSLPSPPLGRSVDALPLCCSTYSYFFHATMRWLVGRGREKWANPGFCPGPEHKKGSSSIPPLLIRRPPPSFRDRGEREILDDAIVLPPLPPHWKDLGEGRKERRRRRQ